MKLEFESGRITIQANAAEWGPFTFDFTNGLPSGRTIAACTVKSYLGHVKPSDSDVLAAETETTSELVGTTAVASSYVVTVKFDRPTTAAYINASHTLVFEFTMDAGGGGGTHSAFYYRVKVE